MNLFEQQQSAQYKLVYKSKNLSTVHYEFEYSSKDLKECEFAAQSACNSIDPMRGPHWEYEGFHGGMHICRLTYWGVD